ncbi:alpha/beta-hydrolase [Sparassis latifolia]|uniref:Alpha/beta-hydrolase n=1 Tax=Sparassis crispa TaxID=139825 RepID=A0A401GTW8_9APHY|nr:alpha/beta-hydrolase [Sparassis crispa]GBE85623.1 alpha/beta-hydrolase [Sparassis crispa]
MTKKIAPYGTWTSPITADAILKTPPKVEEVIVDPVTSTIYHIEARPSEKGRNVLVETEKSRDVVGREWDVRTRVHEYGGAPAIAHNGIIYFSSVNDNRVYQVQDGKEPEAVTPDNSNHRFARLAVHPIHTHLLVSILEDHTKPAPLDVVTTLCVINTKTKTISPLVSGADFYSSPCFTPDGTHIAWHQWFHPDMPWEGAEIYTAKVAADENGMSLSEVKYVAGKKKETSVAYPFWVSNDLLLFINDVSGYQNPWKYSVSSGKASPALYTPVQEDFSQQSWQLRHEAGAALDKEGSRVLFLATRDGRTVVYVLTLQSGALEEIACPYISGLVVRHVARDTVVFIGEKTTEPQSIVLCSLKDYSMPHFTILRPPSVGPSFPASYISVAQPMTLRVSPDDRPIHVLYYPPTHPEYIAPEGEKPPCVVNAHGGPTGMATQSLDWLVQFFTSRGWAWLDVNYGGSSGYGREYVERLKGNWGVVDVEDCVAATQQLAKPPLSLIDSQRTAIRGGSAGGLTVLNSLCYHPTAFAAGTSLYGVADLKSLAEDTHKYESHYLFRLIGGTVEQVPQVYQERSPVNNAEKIKTPLLVLQGSNDAVVPPNQAENIVNTIKRGGGRVEYVVYEGEGHGWRRADTIKAALEKELSFYEGMFGLTGKKS